MRGHASPQPVPVSDLSLPIANAPVFIYKPFFLAALLVVLTVGASWGVSILWRIGVGGSFTSATIYEINAHGHAQIYGWAGLFILGFAAQAFPRFWGTTLVAAELAFGACGLMVIGIILRSAALAGYASPQSAIPLTLIGGQAEAAAVAIVCAQLVLTYRRRQVEAHGSDALIFSALGWLLVSVLASTAYSAALLASPSEEAMLGMVATWQAALRDIQIHGIAVIMILGVSMRLLPGLFGAPRVGSARAVRACVVLNIAVAGEAALLVLSQAFESVVLQGAVYLMWILLTAGVLMIALPFRLWRPFPKPDRSSKFIRAAYAWLAISLLMLLAFPLYIALSGEPFSHAYYGAIRHAITVGFISLMIMGVASRVVGNLNGIDTRILTQLWGPFVLVNLGCGLRVGLQTATDWHPAFFNVVGVSGVLELVGLAWWALTIALLIVRPGRALDRTWRLRRNDAEVSPGCGCCESSGRALV